MSTESENPAENVTPGQAPRLAPDNFSALADWLRECGGGLVAARQMRQQLEARRAEALADWQVFAASWDSLPPDLYMGDGGTYRSRRYAVLSAHADGRIQVEPLQPHYQARSYNALNGGVPRHFEPIADRVLEGATFQSVVQWCNALFSAVEQHADWHIEAHQFRIRAVAGAEGKPTPEGVHRDGVDFVLVLLVGRTNIARGITTLHDANRQMIGSFTLTDALDAAVLDDRRCYHGVTPIQQFDARLPAWRDVLVLTFRKRT